MSENFNCVICCVNPRSKVKYIKPFKICGSCHRAIKTGSDSYQISTKLHTKCAICGDGINHSKKHPLCEKSYCRQKYYRSLKIKKAIETGEYSNVQSVTVRNIQELGYMVKIVKIS